MVLRINLISFCISYVLSSRTKLSSSDLQIESLGLRTVFNLQKQIHTPYNLVYLLVLVFHQSAESMS